MQTEGEKHAYNYSLVSLVAQKNTVRKYNRGRNKRKKRLETDTTVKFSHVIINTLALWECLETYPTCVGVTA